MCVNMLDVFKEKHGADVAAVCTRGFKEESDMI